MKTKGMIDMLFKRKVEKKEEQTDGLLYFYMKGCPYCKMADGYIAELIAENPAFKEINISKVEEREKAAFARSYDYHLVPCLWLGKQKLHEGVPTKDKIRVCMEAALKKADKQ